jgi:hypothetical protein
VSDSDSGESGRDGEGDDSPGLTGRAAVAVAAVVALAATVLVYWWIGGWAGNEVFFEDLFRVAPTVEGGGVGADWVAGNTIPILDALIAIVHAADVLMGVFILGILFIHWAIFRRLADRMRPPASTRSSGTVATDGGERTTGDGQLERKDSEQGGDD